MTPLAVDRPAKSTVADSFYIEGQRVRPDRTKGSREVASSRIRVGRTSAVAGVAYFALPTLVSSASSALADELALAGLDYHPSYDFSNERAYAAALSRRARPVDALIDIEIPEEDE